MCLSSSQRCKLLSFLFDVEASLKVVSCPGLQFLVSKLPLCVSSPLLLSALLSSDQVVCSFCFVTSVILFCGVQEPHCFCSSYRRTCTSSTCGPEVFSNQAQSNSKERVAVSSGSSQQHEVMNSVTCTTSVTFSQKD